jgi:hypothetical protein
MNAKSMQYYHDHKKELIQYQMKREKFLKYKKNMDMVIKKDKKEEIISSV